MLDLAVKDSSWISVSRWELAQPGWTRTALVLQEYERIINAKSLYNRHVNVHMVCGADLLDSFNTEGVWLVDDMHRILRSGIVVLTRTGTKLEEIIEKSPLLRLYKDNIHIVKDDIQNNISSTIIREKLSLGFSVRYLLPDAVVDYIERHRLYGYHVSPIDLARSNAKRLPPPAPVHTRSEAATSASTILTPLAPAVSSTALTTTTTSTLTTTTTSTASSSITIPTPVPVPNPIPAS